MLFSISLLFLSFVIRSELAELDQRYQTSCLNLQSKGKTQINQCQVQNRTYQFRGKSFHSLCMTCTIKNNNLNANLQCEKNLTCLRLIFQNSNMFESFFRLHRKKIPRWYSTNTTNSSRPVLDVMVNKYSLLKFDFPYLNRTLNIKSPRMLVHLRLVKPSLNQTLIPNFEQFSTMNMRRLMLTVCHPNSSKYRYRFLRGRTNVWHNVTGRCSLPESTTLMTSETTKSIKPGSSTTPARLRLNKLSKTTIKRTESTRKPSRTTAASRKSKTKKVTSQQPSTLATIKLVKGKLILAATGKATKRKSTTLLPNHTSSTTIIGTTMVKADRNGSRISHSSTIKTSLKMKSKSTASTNTKISIKHASKSAATTSRKSRLNRITTTQHQRRTVNSSHTSRTSKAETVSTWTVKRLTTVRATPAMIRAPFKNNINTLTQLTKTPHSTETTSTRIATIPITPKYTTELASTADISFITMNAAITGFRSQTPQMPSTTPATIENSSPHNVNTSVSSTNSSPITSNISLPTTIDSQISLPFDTSSIPLETRTSPSMSNTQSDTNDKIVSGLTDNMFSSTKSSATNKENQTTTRSALIASLTPTTNTVPATQLDLITSNTIQSKLSVTINTLTNLASATSTTAIVEDSTNATTPAAFVETSLTSHMKTVIQPIVETSSSIDEQNTLLSTAETLTTTTFTLTASSTTYNTATTRNETRLVMSVNNYTNTTPTALIVDSLATNIQDTFSSLDHDTVTASTVKHYTIAVNAIKSGMHDETSSTKGYQTASVSIREVMSTIKSEREPANTVNTSTVNAPRTLTRTTIDTSSTVKDLTTLPMTGTTVTMPFNTSSTTSTSATNSYETERKITTTLVSATANQAEAAIIVDTSSIITNRTNFPLIDNTLVNTRGGTTQETIVNAFKSIKNVTTPVMNPNKSLTSATETDTTITVPIFTVATMILSSTPSTSLSGTISARTTTDALRSTSPHTTEYSTPTLKVQVAHAVTTLTTALDVIADRREDGILTTTSSSINSTSRITDSTSKSLSKQRTSSEDETNATSGFTVSTFLSAGVALVANTTSSTSSRGSLHPSNLSTSNETLVIVAATNQDNTFSTNRSILSTTIPPDSPPLSFMTSTLKSSTNPSTRETTTSSRISADAEVIAIPELRVTTATIGSLSPATKTSETKLPENQASSITTSRLVPSVEFPTMIISSTENITTVTLLSTSRNTIATSVITYSSSKSKFYFYFIVAVIFLAALLFILIFSTLMSHFCGPHSIKSGEDTSSMSNESESGHVWKADSLPSVKVRSEGSSPPRPRRYFGEPFDDDTF